MMRRLIPLSLITLLGACAHVAERAPEPIPELRVLVVGHPFGRVPNAVEHVRLAHAGNFNTIVQHARAFPGLTDDQGAPRVARLTHELGMDFGLRLEWQRGEGETLERALRRLVARIEQLSGGESLEWLGVGQPVRQDPIEIEVVYARLREAFPDTLLYSGGTPALELAEAGLIDTRVEHVVPPRHLQEIPGLREEMPPDFPQVVRIVLWGYDRASMTGPMAADYIAERIATARRYPYLGVALHWLASFLEKSEIAAMADGPFAVPAVPPQRDWRWSMRRALEMAAASPDCPELIGEGLASLIASVRDGSARDMQIHMALDYLIEINEAHGDPNSMAHRDLEFARICLRQAQARE